MRKNVTAVVTAVLVAFAGISLPGAFGMQSLASSVSELKQKQDETQKKLDANEDKRDEKAEELQDLKDEAKEIEGSLNELNTQLSAIDEKISSANEDINESQQEIDKLQSRMDELEKKQAERFEIMKQHIVFFYENKNQMDVTALLLKSRSFAEFLNRTEFLSAIVEYDKKLINECEAAREEMQEDADALELYQERMKSRKKDLKTSQKEMDVLIASVKSEADENEKNREKTSDELSKIDSKIVSLKMDMKALEASVAEAQAEEARRLAEALAAMEEEQGGREDTTGAYAASASDVTLLAATIEAEAGNQSKYGQQAVASVIMNRVKSSLFPNTIYGVITQEKQFASYRSGMVDAYIEKGPSDVCMEVAQAAIDGERVGDWLFFMTVEYADYYGITGYDVIGDHAFFYKWGAN